jgi:hypothetical protein
LDTLNNTFFNFFLIDNWINYSLRIAIVIILCTYVCNRYVCLRKIHRTPVCFGGPGGKKGGQWAWVCLQLVAWV